MDSLFFIDLYDTYYEKMRLAKMVYDIRFIKYGKNTLYHIMSVIDDIYEIIIDNHPLESNYNSIDTIDDAIYQYIQMINMYDSSCDNINIKKVYKVSMLSALEIAKLLSPK